MPTFFFAVILTDFFMENLKFIIDIYIIALNLKINLQ